jgi:hypothetical protein
MTCSDVLKWFGSVRLNHKGYYRINGGLNRNEYLHRAVWEKVAGRPIPDGWHIHHQDFNKKHCCPHNLIAMPPEFNPSPSRRCPYRGTYVSVEEWKSITGYEESEMGYEYWLTLIDDIEQELD